MRITSKHFLTCVACRWPKKHTFRLFWPRSWWPAAIDSSTVLELATSVPPSSKSANTEDKNSTAPVEDSTSKTGTSEIVSALPSDNNSSTHADAPEAPAHSEPTLNSIPSFQHSEGEMQSSEAHSLVPSPGDLMLAHHQTTTQAPVRMGMGFSRMRRFMGKSRETSALGDVPLLKDLSEAERARVVRQFKRATFKKGQVIVHEGATSNRFFVIGRGTVLFSKADTVDAPKEVSVGACFGELSLLGEESEVMATATAKTDVTAYYLTPEAFSKENKSELGSLIHNDPDCLAISGGTKDDENNDEGNDDCEVPFDELLAASKNSKPLSVDREHVDWDSIIRIVAEGIRPTLPDASPPIPAPHAPLKLPEVVSFPRTLPKPLSSPSSLCLASSHQPVPLFGTTDSAPSGSSVAAAFNENFHLSTFDNSSLSKHSFSTQPFMNYGKSVSQEIDLHELPQRRHSIGDFQTSALFKLVLSHSPDLGREPVEPSGDKESQKTTEVRNFGGWQRNLDVHDKSFFGASLSDDDSESSSDDDSLPEDSGSAQEGRRSWSAKWANLKQTAAQKAQAALEARRARKLAKKGFAAVAEVIAGSSDEEPNNLDDPLSDIPASTPVAIESAPSASADQPVISPLVAAVSADPSIDSALGMAPTSIHEGPSEAAPESNAPPPAAAPSAGSWRNRLKNNVMAKVEEWRERKSAKAEMSVTSEKAAPNDGAPSSPGSSLESHDTLNVNSKIQAEGSDETSLTSSKLDRTAEVTQSKEPATELSKKTPESWRDRLKKNMMAKVEERRERKSAKAEMSVTSEKAAPNDGASSSPGSSFEDNDMLRADSTRSTDEAARSLAVALRGLDHTLNPWFLEAVTTQQRVYASKWSGQWRKGVGAVLPIPEESAQGGQHKASMVSEQCWWVVERPSESDHDAAFTFELVNASSARRLFARKYTPHRWASKVTRPSISWKKQVGAGPPGKTYPDNLWRALPHPESATDSSEISFMVQNVHSGRFLYSQQLNSATSGKNGLEELRGGAEASEKSDFSFGAVGASQLHEAEFLANAAWRLVVCDDGLQGKLPPQEGVLSSLTASELSRADSDSQDESDDGEAEESQEDTPGMDVPATSQEEGAIPVPGEIHPVHMPDV